MKIPFIQEDRLLIAISERESRLTAFERERNRIGNALLFKSNIANAKFRKGDLCSGCWCEQLEPSKLVCSHAYTSVIPSLSFCQSTTRPQ